MSNEMLLFISSLVGIILTYINARNTASSGAIAALSETIETLRAELTEEKKARKEDKKELEEELKRYKAYIELLIRHMKDAEIPIPKFEEIIG